MNLIHQDLARAEVGARLGAARECRRGRRLVRANRADRVAEQLAQRARLALARTI